MTLKLTADRAREVLSYDKDSGLFTYRRSRGCRAAGQLAGADRATAWGAYRQIRIDGHSYDAHRLAWLMMTGEWPALQIDHKDRNGLNNAWSNLREATPLQNNMNRKRRKDATWPKGVIYEKRQKKFIARGTVGGVLIHLGSFATPEEAHEAYKAWGAREFGSFFHDGSTT